MGDGESGTPRYCAFISYSHKDAAIGRWLHRRLEGYRLPRRLAGSEGERGPVPARLTPIFRDREELPAAGDLSEKVRAALADSGALIVVCSPSAVESPWVAKEIATFRALHPDRPILAAIVEGEPAECFSAGLTADGRVEPLAADLRPGRDGRRLGLLKLVAGLSGVGLDALVQRDAQRRVRSVTYVTAAALAAVLIMAVLTVFAFRERREAERQRSQAEGMVEFMLTDLREKLKGVGRIEVLTIVNRRALAYYESVGDIGKLSDDSLERRARVLHAMGEDDEKRDQIPRAGAELAQAHRTTATLLARDPDNPDRVFAHAQSAYWLGRVAKDKGDLAAAAAGFREYRRAAERLYRLQPSTPKYVGEVAYAESNLGELALTAPARPEPARAHFLNALHWFERVGKMDPASRTWREEEANAHAWLADTWFLQGNYDEARRERLAELELKSRLVAIDPQNRDYRYARVVTLRGLASVELKQDRYQAALALLDEARATLAELVRLDPENSIWLYQAVRVEIDAARAGQGLGDDKARVAALRRAQAWLDGAPSNLHGSEEHERLREWVAAHLRGPH
jgi:tetratricopeptide (TPR) repeat protein